MLALLIAWAVLPEWLRIPVEGARARDWNQRTLVRAQGPLRSAQGHRHLRPQRHPVPSASWRLHYYAYLDSLGV
ncbi:hypothetical protein CSB93_1210 [Pseudomonas paraeruginosa]|uniref:Uncharacterized protein n=1 Tax=Pseudomonas paraeruginosa TaxID=2994495 RepID=A0A2R3J2R6_9PSED|nr:hypothetical protein CSB93_1210 [Pseudomonas paraeruginosa]AWE94480.1 hypothetical protein CSC28_6526 [Pseudomonas paraeruginosa]